MMFNKNFVMVVKCAGKILYEKNNIVFLPFGSEYSILLKNLDTKRAVVTVTVDGSNILGTASLVIDGNSEKEIKRFIKNGDMNQGPRLKFIEKTEKISNFRGNKVEDGIIRVEYQFEETPEKSLTQIFQNYGNILPGDFYGNIDSYSINREINKSFVGSGFQSKSAEPVNTDGITVGGTISSQQFEYASIGKLLPEKYAITLKLSGIEKETPVTVKTKKRCKTCGTINKFSNNFCTECGTNLKY